MSEKIQAVRGMNDILPDQAHWWERFEDTVRDWLHAYGYRNIRMPVLERTDLFVRSIGEVTDIVEKEMYTFTDIGGDSLTLRPEATAGLLRAAISNGMLRGARLKLWTAGPMFRHEKPQKGRYRQFHQIGAEVLGFGGPEVDAELIAMAHALWQNLGLKDIRLELNSLGQPEERAAHRAALIAHLEQHLDVLDEEAKRRLHSNPLRILDTKNPAMQPVVETAPKLIDFLGEASLAHFNAVRSVLDAAGLPYEVNPRLVRGMDYYNLTVFEWVTTRLGSQGTVCGGGRYDGLIEQLGGKPNPAVGWGLGMERLLLLLEEVGQLPGPAQPDAFAVVFPGVPLPTVMVALEALRAQGVSVVLNPAGKEGPASPKSQFKKADASGARFALVFGPDEVARGEVAIKPLRDGGEQQIRPLVDIAHWAVSLLQR